MQSQIVENHQNEEVQNVPSSDVSHVLRTSAIGLGGFALLYLLFLGIYLRFPYLRPGDNLVATMKHDTARNGNFFKSARGERIHVVAFGYSKMLSGFRPDLFDSQMAAGGFATESYNFGLPGDSKFVSDLEAMAAHGTAPDIALLTFPWPSTPPPGPTFFHFINNDQELMEELFPFHHLPRNLFILAVQAHSLRRMPEVYEEDKQSVFQVAKDRGYYFISRQSHYPHDELPPTLRLPTDKPQELSPRVVTLGPVYEQLATALAQHKIKCLLIPNYFRDGEFALPPTPNPQTARVLEGQPNVAVVGPDYWLYANRLFSDPEHANRPGAVTYTKDVADLVTGWLKQQKASQQ